HADDFVLVHNEVKLGDDAQTAERLVDVVELEHGCLLVRHTISTYALPKRPCGRAIMRATRSAPSRIRRVAPLICRSKRFSQTNMTAYRSGGSNTVLQTPLSCGY